MDTKPLNDTVSLNNSDINAFNSVIIPIDDRGKEIARGIVSRNENKMYVTRVIENENGKYLDVREYVKYGKDTSFNPSKHGMMIRSDIFRDKMMEVFNNSLKYC